MHAQQTTNQATKTQTGAQARTSANLPTHEPTNANTCANARAAAPATAARTLGVVGYLLEVVFAAHLSISVQPVLAHFLLRVALLSVQSQQALPPVGGRAVCLGAPFWFDLLNKLLKLRTGIALQCH